MSVTVEIDVDITGSEAAYAWFDLECHVTVKPELGGYTLEHEIDSVTFAGLVITSDIAPASEIHVKETSPLTHKTWVEWFHRRLRHDRHLQQLLEQLVSEKWEKESMYDSCRERNVD